MNSIYLNFWPNCQHLPFSLALSNTLISAIITLEMNRQKLFLILSRVDLHLNTSMYLIAGLLQLDWKGSLVIFTIIQQQRSFTWITMISPMIRVMIGSIRILLEIFWVGMSKYIPYQWKIVKQTTSKFSLQESLFKRTSHSII